MLDFRLKWSLRRWSGWSTSRPKPRLPSTTPSRITHGLKISSMIFHPRPDYLCFFEHFVACSLRSDKIIVWRVRDSALEVCDLDDLTMQFSLSFIIPQLQFFRFSIPNFFFEKSALTRIDLRVDKIGQARTWIGHQIGPTDKTRLMEAK